MQPLQRTRRGNCSHRSPEVPEKPQGVRKLKASVKHARAKNEGRPWDRVRIKYMVCFWLSLWPLVAGQLKSKKHDFQTMCLQIWNNHSQG